METATVTPVDEPAGDDDVCEECGGDEVTVQMTLSEDTRRFCGLDCLGRHLISNGDVDMSEYKASPPSPLLPGERSVTFHEGVALVQAGLYPNSDLGLAVLCTLSTLASSGRYPYRLNADTQERILCLVHDLNEALELRGDGEITFDPRRDVTAAADG